MDKIRGDLLELRDEKYKDFVSKIIPTLEKDKIIGIRVPILRKYAKKLLKGNKKLVNEFLERDNFLYFEEKNLYLYFLDEINDIDVVLDKIDKFLPHIDNWGTCDIGLRKIMKKNPLLVYEKIKEWIKSDEIYRIRYGIVSLLQNYLGENFKRENLELVSSIKNEDYYVKMAISWYFSMALVKKYEETLPYFLEKKLDKFVHNKSIQKARESLRMEKDRKEYLKTLKMK